jgi:hypothetical protein
MAVAIWDHAPTGEELVERRRQQGWNPRPTDTVDGEIVLGLGACLIKPKNRTAKTEGEDGGI